MDYSKINDAIDVYFNKTCEAYRLGNVESSYYEPVCRLIEQFGCSARDMSGERKEQTGENIDIKLWRSDDEVTETEPFAGIEVKKVGGIDERARSQIKSEAARYGYAILTDNLVWEFWRSGEESMYAGVQLIERKGKSLVLRQESVDLFISLVEDFLQEEPTQIRSSNKLAEYMAVHARTIRSIIFGILKDDGTGMPLVNDRQKALPMFPELYGLYSKIKSELQPEMKSREFADMYAQTIVYGLFIARYNDPSPESFSRYEALQYLQEESQLLKQFFIHITNSEKKHPTLEAVIDKLCALYRRCDISALLERETHKDTIVHFYETFLMNYDPQLRKSLGVFYTPVEAVRYLISMVDKALVTEFQIPDGLANNERLEITVPAVHHVVEDVQKTGRGRSRARQYADETKVPVPRVAILDPACGTGSFGAEIIKYVKETYFTGSREPFYEQYIQDENGLLSRLIGFEIMMTSYVVAHLKMRRAINETLGHSPDVQPQTNIFLTNTLAPALSDVERVDQVTFFDFSAAISQEAYNADTWKVRRPIKVIIGNPPYSRLSKNPYDISAYKKETDGVTDFGEQKHWLTDDYVQFFRFAEQIINRNNEGILAFVSNNGYLVNPTFRGMRGSLLRSFDKIYIVNLHGSTSKKETTPDGGKDENIFDIRTGVCLFIGIKTSTSKSWANVYYTELWGSRENKLEALTAGGLAFRELSLDQKMAYFIPFGDRDKEAYDRGISISDLFPAKVSGIVSGNDNAAFAKTRRELVTRLDTVKNSTDEAQIAELWGGFGRGQSAEKIKNDALSGGTITQVFLNPFDARWTYYTGNSCGWILWPREKKVMGNLLVAPTSPIGPNIGMVFCRNSTRFLSPFASQHIVTTRFFSDLSTITYIAPLYLHYEDELGGESWEPNLNRDKVNELTQYVPFALEPIQVFDYVYGILHDPAYCEKYGQYLHRDFPRVPVINVPEEKRTEGDFFVSVDDFQAYVKAGERLSKLHLMAEKVPAQLKLEPNTADNMEIEEIRYSEGVLRINKNKCICGISPEVWEYNIGGNQVVDKWLKSHKGETLTIESFTHLENVVGLLQETIAVERELAEMH